MRQTDAGRELRIALPLHDLASGESIAVNGACLTVRERGQGWFTVAAVVTTLGRTTIGEWSEGSASTSSARCALGDRLGGHIVQGHVDGVGTVAARRQAGDALLDRPCSAVPASLELMVRTGRSPSTA